MEKQAGFKLHVTLVCYKLLQVSSIFYRATNTNGILGGFFYHLFSVIYASPFFAVCFVLTFERRAKTFQFLKMIHSGYSRSYFNLFNLCHWVQCT